jgi:hypothetical protein
MGLHYLLVRTTRSRMAMWLPLFLTEPDRFRAALRRHAGPEHPLAVAFEEHA